MIEMLNYGLVLLFGLFLSVHIAGGYDLGRRSWPVYVLGLLFLLVQIVCYFCWGVAMAERLYPLIVHLPLTLILTLWLKNPSVSPSSASARRICAASCPAG